jgi:hypothetical protein
MSVSDLIDYLQQIVVSIMQLINSLRPVVDNAVLQYPGSVLEMI